jgi:hypothetical protein
MDIKLNAGRWAIYNGPEFIACYDRRAEAEQTAEAINRALCPATLAAAVAHSPQFALNPGRKIRLAGIFNFCRENGAQAIRKPGQTWVIGRNGFKCLIVRANGVYFASSHKPQKISARGVYAHLKNEHLQHLQMLKSVKV